MEGSGKKSKGSRSASKKANNDKEDQKHSEGTKQKAIVRAHGIDNVSNILYDLTFHINRSLQMNTLLRSLLLRISLTRRA